jgi:hypothetical protein
MRIKAKLEGAAAVEANIAKLSQSMPQAVASAIHASALAVLVPAMRKAILDNDAVFAGELFRRTTAKAGVGESPYVEIGTFDVPYSLNIEKGSPPHTPDFAKLVAWVEKKLGVKGRSAAVAAGYIMEHIEKYGTKAKPYVVPTFDANKERVVRDFVERLKRELGS